MVRKLIPLALVVAVGCGVSHTDPAPAAPDLKQFVSGSEPSGAKGVIAVREAAKDGDEVTVVGRVGGHAKPFTEGRAVFLIVDESLKPTAECDCPWDYCEVKKETLAAARLSVKFTDDGGKTLAAGAREAFGIKELSTVVVRGTVRRDEKDNVVVVGKSLYVRQ